MENDNEAHSAPVKIEALDEVLSESQAAPPSPQLAVHFLVSESGCGNLDLPPSPPPLPLVSVSMEMGPPEFQITDKPLHKKPQNMNQKPGQLIKACKIQVETVPLGSGTAEIDTQGEEQMEAQQMDGNYREDEVSDRSPAEMAPQGSLPRNLETQAPSQGQRGAITRDTPSGAGDTAAASTQGDVRHIQGPRKPGQTNVKNKRLHNKALSRNEMVQDNQEQEEPVQEPQPQPIPQAGQFVPPQGFNEQMVWLCQQMHAHCVETQQEYRDVQKELRQTRVQMLRYTKAIKSLDEAQSSLMRRFVKQYGASSSSASQTRQGANVEEKILEEPQPQPIPQADQFVPPQGLNEQMVWLCQQMHALRVETQQGYRDVKKGLRQIRAQMLRHTKAIKSLDEAQSSLTRRFVKQYGTSSSSAPQTRQGANVEEKILEEEDAQQEEENVDEEDEEIP